MDYLIGKRTLIPPGPLPPDPDPDPAPYCNTKRTRKTKKVKKLLAREAKVGKIYYDITTKQYVSPRFTSEMGRKWYWAFWKPAEDETMPVPDKIEKIIAVEELDKRKIRSK